MYIYWLKYIRLERKDQNMSSTTLEVVILADVWESRGDFECFPMCDWAPLT